MPKLREKEISENQKLSNDILACVAASGLSKEEIRYRIGGLHHNTLSRYLHDPDTATVGSLRKLAKALDVPIEINFAVQKNIGIEDALADIGDRLDLLQQGAFATNEKLVEAISHLALRDSVSL